jgi:hypothetical protein
LSRITETDEAGGDDFFHGDFYQYVISNDPLASGEEKSSTSDQRT